MKKSYTKKQITEAIAYWKKQLKKMQLCENYKFTGFATIDGIQHVPGSVVVVIDLTAQKNICKSIKADVVDVNDMMHMIISDNENCFKLVIDDRNGNTGKILALAVDASLSLRKQLGAAVEYLANIGYNANYGSVNLTDTDKSNGDLANCIEFTTDPFAYGPSSYDRFDFNTTSINKIMREATSRGGAYVLVWPMNQDDDVTRALLCSNAKELLSFAREYDSEMM